MYCSQCGTRLEASAHFCPNCGKEVHEAEGSAPAREQAADFGRAASAAPRKMALWKKIAIGVVVAIAGIVALGWWATSPLMTPIDNHLAALRSGNVAEAYAQTSASFKSATSQADFEKFISNNPILLKITDISVSSRSFEGDRGQVLGTLTSETGVSLPVEYLLAKENGDWRIIGIDLNPERE